MKIELSRFEKAEIVVKALDRTLRKSDPAFQVAVILVLLVTTPKDTTLADIQRMVKYPRKFCCEVFSRLLDNGVIDNRGMVHANWFDRDTGDVAFWLDVNIGLGFMTRCDDSPSSK